MKTNARMSASSFRSPHRTELCIIPEAAPSQLAAIPRGAGNCARSSGLDRQAGGLPGLDAAGEMGVESKPRRLGDLRRLDGADAGRTGEHHRAAIRIWQIDRIELRQ